MELDEIRKKIDMIDAGIMRLLNERMENAVRLKKLKGEVEDSEREKAVLAHVQKCSYGLVKSGFSGDIYKLIMNESKRLQNSGPLLVGFQGEHGAYSEEASMGYNPSAVPIPCPQFEDVFEGVEKDTLDIGIVPVENSLEGAVTQVNDLLVETTLKVVGEVRIPVHHCLLALPETDYRDIRMVYSHQQALAQCRGFISRNKLEPRPFYDTAGAARMLASEKIRGAAVIASRLSAELYGLEVVKADIEDHHSNSTRFLVISKDGKLADGKTGNKCSMLFSAEHRAGALFSTLKIFSDAGINLTRIESRPMRNDPSKFVFLLDFLGSDQEERIKGALETVKKEAAMFKFMGCYNEAKL